ncbi:MAG: hypothetical protein HRU71_12280 [Planctomycetia bacterium]|nr:MAG: hypothetical protein HRU71_12280 [Planctomycetia bacterium]
MDFLIAIFLVSPTRLGIFGFTALAAMLFIRRRLEGPSRQAERTRRPRADPQVASN